MQSSEIHLEESLLDSILNYKIGTPQNPSLQNLKSVITRKITDIMHNQPTSYVQLDQSKITYQKYWSHEINLLFKIFNFHHHQDYSSSLSHTFKLIKKHPDQIIYQKLLLGLIEQCGQYPWIKSLYKIINKNKNHLKTQSIHSLMSIYLIQNNPIPDLYELFIKNPSPYQSYYLALALYRSGKFTQSLTTLNSRNIDWNKSDIHLQFLKNTLILMILIQKRDVLAVEHQFLKTLDLHQPCAQNDVHIISSFYHMYKNHIPFKKSIKSFYKRLHNRPYNYYSPLFSCYYTYMFSYLGYYKELNEMQSIHQNILLNTHQHQQSEELNALNLLMQSRVFNDLETLKKVLTRTKHTKIQHPYLHNVIYP